MLIVSCADNGTGSDDNTFSGDEGKYGWLVGLSTNQYGSIFHTEDGGQTWERQGDTLTVPNTGFTSVQVYNPDVAMIAGNIADGYGTLLRTTDGGENWERIDSSAGIPAGDLYSVSFVTSNIIWAAGQNNAILVSHDGGDSWESKSDEAYAGLDISDIVAVSENNIWACGGNNDGLILHSTDGGTTWRSEGDPDSLHGHTLISLSVVNENQAWVVGHGGIVLRTTDGGDTWTGQSPVGDVILDVNGVAALDDNRVWLVMDYGNIYYSEDNGENWTQQESASSGFYLLRVCAMENGRAWISGSTHIPPMTGRLLMTDDFGDTWTPGDYGEDAGLWDVDFYGSAH